MSNLVVRGGTVVTSEGAQLLDVAISDGVVVDIAQSIKGGRGVDTLDASGCWVGPGLVDLHT
jgi:dihydroorotase-like cyclic amidohydrolase